MWQRVRHRANPPPPLPQMNPLPIMSVLIIKTSSWIEWMSNGVMGVTLVYSTMAAVLNYFTPLSLWNTKADGAHPWNVRGEQVELPNLYTQAFHFRSCPDPTRLHLACCPQSEYPWMIQLLCLSLRGSSIGGWGGGGGGKGFIWERGGLTLCLTLSHSTMVRNYNMYHNALFRRQSHRGPDSCTSKKGLTNLLSYISSIVNDIEHTQYLLGKSICYQMWSAFRILVFAIARGGGRPGNEASCILSRAER